ncbi:MAG TPA: class I SAM-dependent methyltransferase, partial [Planctomycetaceae bacterium]|nr:class I SAM-dependent methyltransferase [Planctomycetaceae bacterium]
VARNTFGIDVFVGEIDSAPWDAGSFDFISISHVVEHVADPVSMLSRAAELLKPGGSIYVETPNARSSAFRRSRQYWLPLDAPRHLMLFSPDTIKMAAAQAGLVARALETFQIRNGYSWTATYRREEKENHELKPRPMITLRTRVGDALQNLEARARKAGDVLGVLLSHDKEAVQRLPQRAAG